MVPKLCLFVPFLLPQYAERKGLPLERIRVHVVEERTKGGELGDDSGTAAAFFHVPLTSAHMQPIHSPFMTVLHAHRGEVAGAVAVKH